MDPLENLKKGAPHQFKSGEAAAEAGRKGGVKCWENKRRARNLQELAKAMLETNVLNDERRKRLEELGLDGTNGGAMLAAMLDKALKGSEKAAAFVRDTSGQAPTQNVAVTLPENATDDDLKGMSDEDLRRLADQEDDA